MKPHQSNARPATTYRGARRAAAREQKLMWRILHDKAYRRGTVLFIHVEP